MSNKSKNTNKGCLLSLLPLLVAAGAVVLIVRFVENKVAATFISIGALIVLAIIVFSIIRAVDSMKSAAQKRAENLAIVNAIEEQYEPIEIDTSSDFSCPEEASVNVSFRQYMNHSNDVAAQRLHVEYLKKKEQALRELNRIDEAEELSIAVQDNQKKLTDLLQCSDFKYHFAYASIFWRDQYVMEHYNQFSSMLPRNKVEFLEHFLDDKQVRILSGKNGNLIFTPAYLLVYIAPNVPITLYRYANMVVSCDIYTEIQRDRAADDEVDYITYRYTKKDGTRDRRYSYANNPAIAYVYRGRVKLSIGGRDWEIKKSNKTKTRELGQSIQEYIDYLEKYEDTIDQMLQNNDHILSAEDVIDFEEWWQETGRNLSVSKERDEPVWQNETIG